MKMTKHRVHMSTGGKAPRHQKHRTVSKKTDTTKINCPQCALRPIRRVRQTKRYIMVYQQRKKPHLPDTPKQTLFQGPPTEKDASTIRNGTKEQKLEGAGLVKQEEAKHSEG